MALKGTFVLEIVGLAPAPFCGLLLSDFGAQVLRIDRPFNRQPESLKRGKRTLLIDLKSSKGKSILKMLSDRADVIIEPFRPGVMEKLNLGPIDLMQTNERLIYARLTGYGQSGHLSKKAGHDINYLAISGILSKLGPLEYPLPPLNILGDFAGGGLMCAFGICLALFERVKSGKGQVIDANITEGTAYLSSWVWNSLSDNYPIKSMVWVDPCKRGVNVLDGGSPFYKCYSTKDSKFMAVGALEPQFYAQFATILGIDNDVYNRFDIDNWHQLNDKISEIFATKTQEEWTTIFDSFDSCVTPVLDLDSAHKYKHNMERNSFFADGMPKPSPILSRTPADHFENTDTDGIHTEQVLLELGFSRNEIKDLENQKVIETDNVRSKL